MTTKGIILAGGSGTRLHPATLSVSKQLLPVYDKPLIYYPLATLIQSKITEILIITTPEDSQSFRDLLGDGSKWGVNISFEVQPSPDGLAQAFIIGEKFIGNDNVCLILGDNIFYGSDIQTQFLTAKDKNKGATVFAYFVTDPERYGVVSFDEYGKAIELEEKPDNPKSSFAITGLYMYDNSVIDIAKSIKPSPRGELEITDVNREYLKNNALDVEVLDRGTAWLDTGTFNSLLDAANFIRVLEERQGLKIACIEEIAYHEGYIDAEQLKALAQPLAKSGYGDYLLQLLK